MTTGPEAAGKKPRVSSSVQLDVDEEESTSVPKDGDEDSSDVPPEMADSTDSDEGKRQCPRSPSPSSKAVPGSGMLLSWKF